MQKTRHSDKQNSKSYQLRDLRDHNAPRPTQLAGTFSWSTVWSFVGRGHNCDPSAPCYFSKTRLEKRYVSAARTVDRQKIHVKITVCFGMKRNLIYQKGNSSRSFTSLQTFHTHTRSNERVQSIFPLRCTDISIGYKSSHAFLCLHTHTHSHTFTHTHPTPNENIYIYN